MKMDPIESQAAGSSQPRTAEAEGAIDLEAQAAPMVDGKQDQQAVLEVSHGEAKRQMMAMTTAAERQNNGEVSAVAKQAETTSRVSHDEAKRQVMAINTPTISRVSHDEAKRQVMAINMPTTLPISHDEVKRQALTINRPTGGDKVKIADEEMAVQATDFNFDATPLPEPMPQQEAPEPRLPGAYASTATPEFVRMQSIRQGVLYASNTSTEPLQDQGSNELDVSGLAQANPVASIPFAEEAQPVDPNKRSRPICRTGKLGICAGLAILGILTFTGIAAALFKPPTNVESRQPREGSRPDSENTTQSEPGNVLKLDIPIELPLSTLATIQSDTNGTSPQYQAYEWVQSDPWLGNYTQERLLQRFAMATLYFETNGTNWRRTGGGTATVPWRNHTFETQLFIYSNPKPDGPPQPFKSYNLTSEEWLSYGTNECDWYSHAELEGGTTCDPSRRILERLSIRSNYLTRQLPKELGLLTQLTHLELWNNDLTGTIPTHIGSLQKLNWLSMSDNQLTGSIPTEVGLLSDLHFFTLINNKDIRGAIPSEIYHLSKLEALKVGRNQLTGSLPEDLGRYLPDLKLLIIARNQFTGSLPTSLGLCRDLVLLEAAENQITGTIPTELGANLRLGKMYLTGNQISGTVPSELGLIPKLVSLRLDGNVGLTGTLSSELGRLNGTLDELSLKGTAITGTIPAALCGVPKLTFDCSRTLCGCGCSC